MRSFEEVKLAESVQNQRNTQTEKLKIQRKKSFLFGIQTEGLGISKVSFATN
jgi:hypothetical protein